MCPLKRIFFFIFLFVIIIIINYYSVDSFTCILIDIFKIQKKIIIFAYRMDDNQRHCCSFRRRRSFQDQHSFRNQHSFRSRCSFPNHPCQRHIPCNCNRDSVHLVDTCHHHHHLRLRLRRRLVQDNGRLVDICRHLNLR